MEFEKKLHYEDENIDNSNVNIKDLIIQYLRYWKWFVLSVLVCLVYTLYILNFERPLYSASATIKIKDDQGDNNSTLSVFQDIGLNAGSNESIEDEIEILKSKSLLSEVVTSLNLNIRFFTNKNYLSNFLDKNLGFKSHYYETENYINPPLKINFLMSDSLVFKTNAKFIVSIKSGNNFTVTDIENTFENKHDFGEKINLGFGDIIIIPNIDLKKNNLIGKNVLVNITAVKKLARRYASSVGIQPKSDYSNILSLTIADGVRKKAEDFLNELVKKYNERAISIKEELSRSTSDFVTRRLEIISNELSDVDLTAETLKTRYKISDASSETMLNQQSGQAIEQQIVQANTQLQILESVKDYVSTKDANEFIPANIGIGDNNIETTFQQYNELMLQKKRLLKNSTDKNPIIININEQLETLKGNIDSGLDNLQSAQKISIDALNKQDALINSRLYSAPKQERQIRDVQRQQGIKESLYLYLLQKREETAITLGVADPNAEIIDPAESVGGAISPKKKIYYMASILLGLLIPFVIIYLSDFFNTKIKSREEVEKMLDIPIVGDIPKLETKQRFLISKEDHSSVAEAFRIIRTNLNFLLTHSTDKGKTIFITSTIASEGKSFVASNLATSLGYAGKKTLIIGMDIRAPALKPYIRIRGSKGVTNFIVDQKMTINDIIVKVPHIENLDLISSGDLAPNPAELLMNTRVKELFDEVKEIYDYIIVDTAASSIIADTSLICSYADAFIYVIRAHFLDKRLLGYVKSVYNNKRFPNMALLINGIDHKKGYGYGYGYGYGHNMEKSKRKFWWKLNL